MDLEFRNLTYTVYSRLSRGTARQVVKGVNGKFMSGQLIAIMGPSGAGKSSLLNAISGYRSAGVTGELLVNGEIRDEQQFQRSSCYITQEDLLQPLLTVREAMDVAASLKLPRGVKAPSEDILQQMGLLEHQHTRTDQLSGGQKKRLSIALELVNNPPVFFLDEPTSGLDTVTTVHCVKTLKQLARQGRTVVCTIHQPAASLFEQFDQVYIIADGLCIYQGDTDAMVPHLARLGMACPRHHNPADFIIELTENPQTIQILSEEALNGKIYRSSKIDSSVHEPMNNMQLKICYQTDNDVVETEIVVSNERCSYKVKDYTAVSTSSTTLASKISQEDTSVAWMKVNKALSRYPTSYFDQFSIILCRMLLQISRNKQALWIQSIHHIGCAILIGVCFLNMANDGTQMFNHLKMCVGLVIFFVYTQIMVPVLVYPQEVKLVKKEQFNGWYNLAPYYAALTVSKLPVQVSLNIIFCTIVYFMVGVPYAHDRFLVFCLIGNIVSLVSEGVGMAIGSVFSVRNGCAIGPAAIAPFLGLAIYGFDFAHKIPLMMTLIMKTSFIRCGVVAMVLTIFGFGREPLDCTDVYCHFSKPNVLLKYLDIENSSVWLEIFLMVFIMLTARFLCFMGLRWRFAT
ncbi:ATP-binding cassette sub-family G member 1 [Leptidea sinapis]|uniref:ATP-binding cassette sub-family G member 1 n=1 Tax=Leptidea sinapis TaxID=189913 RepID=UPI002142427F|nr:ATP-binding cassette sub-family G member 1 [Leptidea sinapis]XP_050680944.1 ATP-binding cassette sub-family G member 1 [Leptidea sinapis]